MAYPPSLPSLEHGQSKAWIRSIGPTGRTINHETMHTRPPPPPPREGHFKKILKGRKPPAQIGTILYRIILVLHIMEKCEGALNAG